ncbi:glucose transporter [Deinococcus radiopugnans]|uniref:Glucose transporter n=2 Tax=Deinococcus radiopugnans TaxID=57497 RepID=A0A0A7KDN4_9DEIO|nr:sugar ABC transporter permease [Deinococcus radiopugnans]AIZ44277.1 glucose transporter [Deinococcus radiopugnans]MBB6015680.1 glucose/mannose transport system permease protein [Deinococcus radiopugnans ATCC 19172]QLG09846.1 sugar ABC transporter permease [Deinococcus sp. D7000]TNM72626.1 sugar ABC transporter permease [Deinococcus radiopugnans ATCC 19172]
MKRLSKDRLWAIAVLTPSILLIGIFVYYFIGRTVYVSLTDWGNDPAQALALNPIIRWVGLQNYSELFTGFLQGRFRQELVNTLFFTLFFILGCLGVGLGLALILDRNPRGEGLWRTIFLFPMSLSFIVTGTIWRWMLQPQGGVNQAPTLLGGQPSTFGWLSSNDSALKFDWNNLPLITAAVVGAVLIVVAVRAAREGQRTRTLVAAACAALLIGWAIFVGPNVKLLAAPELHGFNFAMIGIIIAAVWQMSGYTMALYLAGLRGIPEELREAAKVDGARDAQMYRFVIFPLLSPITLSAMIILGHISLKIFDLVYAMAGPDNVAASVPALNMYLTSFRQNQFALGAAIGTILLILVAFVIVPYLANQFKGEEGHA